MNVLTLNGGSSSLKFAVYRAGNAAQELELVHSDAVRAGSDAEQMLAPILARVARDGVDAVGHRIVFGGPRYESPVLASSAVMDDLEALVAVEPLHLRAELDLVYAVRHALPRARNVLCFDTAFHRRSPAIAHRLPLPPDLDPLLQRYGFHGLSYEYVASHVPADAGRTVIAHLGSGASLCALRDRVPVDTTMGFTALGGLMMGTRPGDLDPGIVLRLLRTDNFDLERLTDLLYYHSGLLGVSGSTADMKSLLDRASTQDSAREAVDLFVYQLVKQLGAMVAVLGGLDTLVFTGGIGENAAPIRDRVVASLAYLGDVRTLVIPTDENLMIARHTLRLTNSSPESRGDPRH